MLVYVMSDKLRELKKQLEINETLGGTDSFFLEGKFSL